LGFGGDQRASEQRVRVEQREPHRAQAGAGWFGGVGQEE